MSRLHLILTVVMATAFAQASGQSHSSHQSPPAQASNQQTVGVPAGLGKTRVMSGTVDFLDSVNRRVVVKEADGRASMINMGPQVKGFENLRRGDKVTIRSSEALALAIAKNEEGDTGEIRQLVEANAARQDPAGGKPGVVTTGRSTLVANVYQIDRDAGTVTLRGTDGVPVELSVRDAQALQGISLNDQVVVSYVEATALSVEAGSTSAAVGGGASEGANRGQP